MKWSHLLEGVCQLQSSGLSNLLPCFMNLSMNIDSPNASWLILSRRKAKKKHVHKPGSICHRIEHDLLAWTSSTPAMSLLSDLS